MRLLVFCLFAFGFCDDIQCPAGFTSDNNGNCFSKVFPESTYSDGYRTCADVNSFMLDIKNAFDNNKILDLAYPHSYLRLGLTCASNSFDSCTWDSGRTIGSGYNNFFGRTPNITAGPCVKIDLRSGIWYSTDCYSEFEFLCQYTPEISVSPCTDLASDYFRGQCYFQIQSEDVYDARQKCQAGCGDLPAIHSDGENSFITSYANNGNSISGYSRTYTLLGLKTEGNPSSCDYAWMDGADYDYSRFGYMDSNLGNCASMALADDIVKQSYWINSPCSTTESYIFVCFKAPNTTCNNHQCTAPITATGSGDIYSPGYPERSGATTCQYLISEAAGNVASIRFPVISLDSYGSISLYDNLLETTPFAYLSNTIFNDTVFYSPTNTLKVVFQTTKSTNSFFHGVYSAAPLAKLESLHQKDKEKMKMLV